MALRRGAGSVRVVSQENPARPQSAGGNALANRYPSQLVGSLSHPSPSCSSAAWAEVAGNCRLTQTRIKTRSALHTPLLLQGPPHRNSPASLSSDICTSHPPFPAELLHPALGCTSPTPGSQAAAPSHPPLCIHGSLLSFQIGAGVSLPGIVAAKCGAQVTLSDSEQLPQCLEISQQSCLMNHLPHVPVIGITWGRVSPELLSLAPVDIILGSDVFFDPKGTLNLSGTSDWRQTQFTKLSCSDSS